MTNEIQRFEQFFASVTERLEQAQTTDEVIAIHKEASVLAAAARAAKNREYEEKAATVKQQSERRLGQLMAAQRDAGMMNPGSKGTGTKVRGNENPTLENAGIDKNLAKAARKAYSEGWPQKPYGGPKIQDAKDKILAYEAETGKLPPTTWKKFEIPGVTPSSYWRAIREIKSARAGEGTELHALRERIVELEAENARLKSDLEALQTGNIMRMSQAAMLQRKELAEKLRTKREARKAVETAPDEKTKEEFERQIQSLKAQLRTEKSKVLAFAANGKILLDKRAYKGILVCLHPDGAIEQTEKARREKAFKSFTSAVPEPEF